MHYTTGPNNLCFRFAEDRKTWHQAKRQCETEGAILVNTQSRPVYDFVRQHIESSPAKAVIKFGLFGIVDLFSPWDNGRWIGARKSSGRTYKWFNGRGVGGHWCKGMPDNFFFSESCLEQMAGNNGWNDYNCDKRLRYVCQKTANPCGGLNCGKGRCVAKGAHASCVCNKGWTGDGCNVVVDPCEGVDCGNGQCVADKMIGGSHRCICSKGWTGDGCNIVVDPCKGVDCGHGKCVADKMIGGSARCICAVGWTGAKCDAIPDLCAKKPCRNGGKCVATRKFSPTRKPGRPDYKCLCPANFRGRNCENSCRLAVNENGLPVKMEAMILFDGSGSVGDDGFKATLEFISNIVNNMDLAPEKTRVELVQFSEDPEVELDFGSSVEMDFKALKSKVSSIKHMGWRTFTGKALARAADIFNSEGRKEKDVAKLLLVITDGQSNDGDQIPAAVANLKKLGVETVAVGVGEKVNAEELKLIAGEKVFTVGSFKQLDHDLLAKMLGNICK